MPSSVTSVEIRSEQDAARAELVSRIVELETQLFVAKQALATLESKSKRSIPAQSKILNDLSTPAVTGQSSSAEKMALFMDRFQGRKDVYATRWVSSRTGKSGWSPAVRGGFYTDEATPSDHLALDARVVEAHLRGNPGSDPAAREFRAGIYPLLEGDLCRLLVCDFDDADWKRDATAYVAACSNAGVNVLAEISRSGQGAHVWMFFESPMPAAIARAAGAALLKRAMNASPEMGFESYDRFFPAQDTLPRQSAGRARLGNLIALPCRVIADVEALRSSRIQRHGHRSLISSPRYPPSPSRHTSR